MSSGKKQTQSAWQTDINNVRQASGAEKHLNDYSSQVMDYFNSDGKDITKARFMQPYMQTYNQANERANQARMGTGAVGLAQPGSEQYAAKIRALLADERARNFAGGIENAASGAFQTALGTAGNVAQLSNQRNLGALSSSTNLYNSELSRPSPWASLIGGAAQVASNSKWIASDRRLKDKIKPNPYGLEEVLRLNPVWYVMDGQEQIGFIAQEVEEIMPELVVETREGIKGIMYGNMAAVLANAIQELHFEVLAARLVKTKKRKRKMLSSLRSWLKSIL